MLQRWSDFMDALCFENISNFAALSRCFWRHPGREAHLDTAAGGVPPSPAAAGQGLFGCSRKSPPRRVSNAAAPEDGRTPGAFLRLTPVAVSRYAPRREGFTFLGEGGPHLHLNLSPAARGRRLRLRLGLRFRLGNRKGRRAYPAKALNKARISSSTCAGSARVWPISSRNSSR